MHRSRSRRSRRERRHAHGVRGRHPDRWERRQLAVVSRRKQQRQTMARRPSSITTRESNLREAHNGLRQSRRANVDIGIERSAPRQALAHDASSAAGQPVIPSRPWRRQAERALGLVLQGPHGAVISNDVVPFSSKVDLPRCHLPQPPVVSTDSPNTLRLRDPRSSAIDR